MPSSVLNEPSLDAILATAAATSPFNAEVLEKDLWVPVEADRALHVAHRDGDVVEADGGVGHVPHAPFASGAPTTRTICRTAPRWYAV